MIPCLSDYEKEFINTHVLSDTSQILLSKKYQAEPRLSFLVEQIAARQKIRDKLPSWYQNLNLILPASLNLEQSSSELTARFKSTLVSGRVLFDGTGGMGVDFFELMHGFEHGVYLDQNEKLVTNALCNSKYLTTKTVHCIVGNSIEYLQSTTQLFDVIYLDPARRGQAGQKVYQLSDCEPDIISNLSLLRAKASQILIKTSPILDIQLAINQLKYVDQIYVLQIKNEVKELLFLLKDKVNDNPQLSVFELFGTQCRQIAYNYKEEQYAVSDFSNPKQYIYEPSAGILKTGAFKLIGQKFSLEKLHENTHLYTSNELVEGFPGRVFELNAILKPDKKEINNYLKMAKAHITVRNFPVGADELRKKWAVKDGGDVYLLACTILEGKKVVLATSKIKSNG